MWFARYTLLELAYSQNLRHEPERTPCRIANEDLLRAVPLVELGERVGGLHVVGVSKEAADKVRSQLSVLQRSEISNPPTYGARIVRVSSLYVSFYYD